MPTEATSGVTGTPGTSPRAAGCSLWSRLLTGARQLPVDPRYIGRVRGGCRSLCRPGEGGLEVPARPPGRAPAPLHRALTHFRAVPTSTSHGVASAPSPRSRAPRQGKSPRSAPCGAINQPRGCCPGPLPELPSPPRRHRWSIRAARFFPVRLPLPFAQRWIRTWSPDAAGPAAGAEHVGWGPRPRIAAGERRERFGHRAARRCGGTPGLWPWHGGNEDPLCQHLLGGWPVPGPRQGTRPGAGLGNPALVDRPGPPVGLRWRAGLGGAGRWGPVGRAPWHRRLLFLRVMFLFLIPFAFSPALPPSSISSASVTSSVAAERHGAVMEPDILLNKRVFFLWKPGCLPCAFVLPQVVF